MLAYSVLEELKLTGLWRDFFMERYMKSTQLKGIAQAY